ncbi:MAG: nucleotidyltransferase [Anaerolinea sp.]|nr:nucleotidyltransferase [Anaerolinea sp.]
MLPGVDLSARLLRQARLSAGLTQADLARRAGTSQPAIAAYESGRKTPSVATMERLLAATGTGLSAQLPAGRRSASRLRRLLADRRSEVLRIAARHHATNVRVFGSVARGDDSARSDIDLLVDMAPGRSLLDQVRLRRDLSELLGVEVDVITSGGLLERDGRVILDDAVPL